MSSVNKAIIIGHVGKQPEVRYTSGGSAVANFSVATNRKFETKSGEKKESTEWHKIIVWGKSAEFAGSHIKKWDIVFVDGRIETREYKKEGQKKYVTEITAENLQLISSKSMAVESSQAEVKESAPVADDDIPF